MKHWIARMPPPRKAGGKDRRMLLAGRLALLWPGAGW
jgi:hypothetical protein